MIVVTISRRPLGAGSVAANLLGHGVGAINIDATRIGTAADLPEVHATHRSDYPQSYDRTPEGQPGWGRSRGGLAGDEVHWTPRGGRWPANLLLGHLPACTRLGTKRVESTSGVALPHHRRNAPMGENGIYGHGDLKGSKLTCYVAEDGTEVVEAWECAPDCPVADIDRQSGVTVSTGGRAYQNTNDMYSGGWSHTGRGLPVDPGFGDVGGASRYFKQVGGRMSEGMETGQSQGGVPQDLLDYLHTLITPTHVGGESLIALDLNAVDWASIPDGKYHGLIARGEPTPEQVEHMWRVVKPGAHVLLIAPEECPTGHRGACTLEDRGFEIRDAILWVNEAGKLHYVPKANSKERNLGCDHLAAKRKGPPIYDLTEEAASDEEVIGELQEALLEAGVAEDVVEAIQENGLPKDQIPSDFRHLFKKREGGGKYGNNHPTVKPKDVLKRLLSDIPEGATVLDPFMGSGSMGLACLETGHNYIGIEKEAEYIEIADARVRYWDQARAAWDGATIDSEAPREEKPSTEIGLDDLLDL